MKKLLHFVLVVLAGWVVATMLAPLYAQNSPSSDALATLQAAHTQSGFALATLEAEQAPPPPPTETSIPPTATTELPPDPFPACQPGTVAAETHSWWQEGEETPRHAHTAACIPIPGSPLDGPFEVVVRYTAFASPHANVNRIRWRWDTGYTDQQSVDWTCPGEGWDVVFEIGDQVECRKYVTFTIDPAKRHNTPDDLRLEQLLAHTDLGTESRVGLTSELGGGGVNLRARGWYTGLDYLLVVWPHVGDWIPAGETLPTLSGQVHLPIEFRNCDGDSQHSALYIDPPFHAHHGGTGPEPVPVWQSDGCPKDGIPLDASALAPGAHLLYAQATEVDSRGEHSVALAIPVWVGEE